MTTLRNYEALFVECLDNEVYSGSISITYSRVLFTIARVYTIRTANGTTIGSLCSKGGVPMREEEEKEKSLQFALDKALLMGTTQRETIMRGLFVFKLWDKITLVFGLN